MYSIDEIPPPCVEPKLPVIGLAKARPVSLDGKATLLEQQFVTASALIPDECTRHALSLLLQLIQDVRDSVRVAVEVEVSRSVQSIEWRPYVRPRQPGRNFLPTEGQGADATSQPEPAVSMNMAPPIVPQMASDRLVRPPPLVTTQTVSDRQVKTHEVSTPPVGDLLAEDVLKATEALATSAAEPPLPIPGPMTRLITSEVRAPSSIKPQLRISNSQATRPVGVPLHLPKASPPIAAQPPLPGDASADPPAPRTILLAAERERAFKAKQVAMAWEPLQTSRSSAAPTAVFTGTPGSPTLATAEAPKTAEERLRAAQMREEESKSALPLWLKISAGMPTRSPAASSNSVSPSPSTDENAKCEPVARFNSNGEL